MAQPRRVTRILLALALAVVLSGQGLVASRASANGDQPLFVASPVRGSLDTTGNPTIVRTRFVDVRLDLLTGKDGLPESLEAGSRLLLNLFDDVQFTAVLDRVERTSPDSYTWFGHLEGVALSQATLAVKGQLVAGNVTMPGAFYAVRYAGNGVHAVQEIDQSAFPDEMDPLPVVLPEEPPARSAPVPEADDGSQIDVLVVYTQGARAAVGGTAAMQNLINLAVAETNTSYANSQINQRVRLVWTAEVVYTEVSFSTDLNRLTNKSDGYMDNVHTLRDTYAADEVVLIINNDVSCGIAWLMTTVSPSFEAYAFAVVHWDCAVGYFSFGHEMGHNMGARHDWYVDEDVTPYAHSHGYVNAADRWRTVMAYNDECYDQGFNCTRLQYWSNPSVTYGGDPMGVPSGTSTSCHEGVPNPHCDADNHLTLNKTAYTVANFRQSVPATPSPPSNLTATAVSQSQINLSWADNSNNEIGFKIERSPDGSTNWQQIATVGPNVTAYADTSLAAGTTYYYRVRAYNAAGDSAYSNVAHDTTWPPSPTKPSPPSNLSASAVSQSQINLSWADNSNNEIGFKIERSPDGSTNWQQIATVGANVTAYANTGLPSGKTYYYRVRAYNAAGDSAYSNVAHATTWSGGSRRTYLPLVTRGVGGSPCFGLPIDEGFEAGAVPPSGWTRQQTNPRQTWKIMTVGTPYEGWYAADCLYDDQDGYQNELLISPPFRVGSAALEFRSFGSLYWCRDIYDNCDLNVWLVVGAWGGGDDIYVGLADDDWTATWVWSASSFDLTSLLPAGQPVRVAFQYEGQGGAQVGLDAIHISGSCAASEAPRR